MPAATIQKFVDNGTYQSETTFKGALTNQILQAVERINANLTKNGSRQVLYVDDKKVYLTDLMFKFYLDWK
jgi:enamine deaminase RidA (YjgF/YER057c/UK114 family)